MKPVPNMIFLYKKYDATMNKNMKFGKNRVIISVNTIKHTDAMRFIGGLNLVKLTLLKFSLLIKRIMRTN